MAVERERVAEPSIRPVKALFAERAESGKWTLVLAVDQAIELADGRVLRFDREVRVSGHQVGRKPNPPGWAPWEARKARKNKRSKS